MNTDELTQVANVHQQILTRHDQEMSEIRTELKLSNTQHNEEIKKIHTILDRVAEQQEATFQAIAANQQAIAANQQAIAQLSAEQQLGRQDINSLTASILELRNMVADYIESRSQANP